MDNTNSTPPAPHYGDDLPTQQYSSQQFSSPPPQQYSSPPPQQYQQGYGYNQSGHYQPPQQTYQPQSQSDYEPKPPNTTQTSRISPLLPPPTPLWHLVQIRLPYEETLIVQNPCDFRTEDVEIKNSRHEVLLKCFGLHKAHAKDYPHREGKPECIIRSASGEDLIIIRHDPNKKLTNYFSLEDASDGQHNRVGSRRRRNTNKHSLQHLRLQPSLQTSRSQRWRRKHGEMSSRGEIFKTIILISNFENTENRFAMLRNDYE